jgi:hypothetical protein
VELLNNVCWVKAKPDATKKNNFLERKSIFCGNKTCDRKRFCASVIEKQFNLLVYDQL